MLPPAAQVQRLNVLSRKFDSGLFDSGLFDSGLALWMFREYFLFCHGPCTKSESDATGLSRGVSRLLLRKQ